jgi:hypothetical protein
MEFSSRVEAVREKGVKPCQRARSWDARVRHVGHSLVGEASGVWGEGRNWTLGTEVEAELE